MRFLFFWLVIGLIACAAPALRKGGLEKQYVELGPMQFAVFSDEDEFHAVFMSEGRKMKIDKLIMRGTQAIEIATGCRVVSKTVAVEFGAIKATIKCIRHGIRSAD